MAHEFGHAFGLEHTFSEDDETKKKNEKKTVEESKFYSDISTNIDICFKRFQLTGEYYQKYWTKYKGVKFAFLGLDIVLKELKEKTIDESENKRENNISSSEIANTKINIRKKGASKENFMDYLDSDLERKTFTITQITNVLK